MFGRGRILWNKPSKKNNQIFEFHDFPQIFQRTKKKKQNKNKVNSITNSEETMTEFKNKSE